MTDMFTYANVPELKDSLKKYQNQLDGLRNELDIHKRFLAELETAKTSLTSEKEIKKAITEIKKARTELDMIEKEARLVNLNCMALKTALKKFGFAPATIA